MPVENWRDGITPYKYNASHAEKQVSMYGGTEIGVTRGMCDDCQNYFAAKAQFHNKEYIVADPTTIHIFTIEGVQIDIDRSTNAVTVFRH